MNTSYDMSAQQANEQITRKFISRVYGWMAAALVVSSFAAFAVINSATLLQLIFGSRFGYIILIVGQLTLVTVLSAGIRKMSFPAAAAAFAGYSVLNGVTFAVVFLVYTQSSVISIFLIAALMFACMSVYGMTTKSDLHSVGRYLIMALLGLVIASLVNFFLHSSSLSWFISFIAVGVFTGLTAYDSQKIMQLSVYAQDNETYKKVALIGALELYLDFINLFLALIRLFGKRR